MNKYVLKSSMNIKIYTYLLLLIVCIFEIYCKIATKINTTLKHTKFKTHNL